MFHIGLEKPFLERKKKKIKIYVFHFDVENMISAGINRTDVVIVDYRVIG